MAELEAKKATDSLGLTHFCLRKCCPNKPCLLPSPQADPNLVTEAIFENDIVKIQNLRIFISTVLRHEKKSVRYKVKSVTRENFVPKFN